MRLSTATAPPEGEIALLAGQVLAGASLDAGQLTALARAGGRNPWELLHWAWLARSLRFGNAVRLCAIVPGKRGGCTEDCSWCGQSGVCRPSPDKPAVTPTEGIVAAARAARRWGAGCFGIINSGRRPSQRDLAAVAEAVAGLNEPSDPPAGESGFSHPPAGPNPHRAPHLCASLGELTDEQAAQLADAGITRYNHNLDTSRRFFPQVVRTHSYDDRLATLAAAKRAGLELCCGGIFGMGETWDDRVDLALTLRDRVGPRIVPMNFLHPIAGTPLEHVPPLSPIEILTIVAVFRLAMPDVDLMIAGGRENLRSLQSQVFHAGATSCISGDYLTYQGQPAASDVEMLADLGMQVVDELPNAGV
ncbi:MAG: biotin synthase BioB [Planctomycetota bacterium]|nr:biotin synthase BioB [Planctomycetota bacterium]